jgi:hypothetical protein
MKRKQLLSAKELGDIVIDVGGVKIVNSISPFHSDFMWMDMSLYCRVRNYLSHRINDKHIFLSIKNEIEFFDAAFREQAPDIVHRKLSDIVRINENNILIY